MILNLASAIVICLALNNLFSVIIYYSGTEPRHPLSLWCSSTFPLATTQSNLSTIVLHSGPAY